MNIWKPKERVLDSTQCLYTTQFHHKMIDYAVIHLKKSFYPKKKTTNTPQDAPGISTIWD